MVNWTNESLDVNAAWDKNSKYDLPVPNTVHECWDCVNEMDEIIGLFESDDIYDDDQYHTADSVNLLSNLDPKHLTPYSDDWDHSVKMWLFRSEVLGACQSSQHDKSYKNYLIAVCQHYLCLVYDRMSELGEDIR